MDTASPLSAISDVSLPLFATCPTQTPALFSPALLGFESPPFGDVGSPSLFEPALVRPGGLGDAPKLFVQATMSRSRRM